LFVGVVAGHAQQADNQGGGISTNTMPGLAFTMKSNPKMRVMLTGGYFDAWSH
jgi:hypothetical protein